MNIISRIMGVDKTQKISTNISGLQWEQHVSHLPRLL